MAVPITERLEELRRVEQDIGRQALDEIGAFPDLLTDEERKRLDVDGFVVLPDVLETDQIQHMTAKLDVVIARAWEDAGGELPGNRDERCVVWKYETVVKDLANRGPLFDVMFTHPRVMAAVRHVIGDWIGVCYLHMRTPGARDGNQEMHPDTLKMAFEPVHYFCNTIWMLDDFTEDNGPTRSVPGSHRFGRHPPDVMPDGTAPHPDEVYITGKAGSVIVFDGHVWHSGTRNNTDVPRRALFSSWVHRDRMQIDNQRELIKRDTYERLSDGSRFLLDVHAAWPPVPDLP